MGKGGTGHAPAGPFEPAAITAIDRRSRVDNHAADLGGRAGGGFGREGFCGFLKTPMVLQHAHQACMLPGGESRNAVGARVVQGAELQSRPKAPDSEGQLEYRLFLTTGTGAAPLPEK